VLHKQGLKHGSTLVVCTAAAAAAASIVAGERGARLGREGRGFWWVEAFLLGGVVRQQLRYDGASNARE